MPPPGRGPSYGGLDTLVTSTKYPQMPFLKSYAAVGAVMLALDMLWLGVIAKGFYAKYMGPLLRPDVRWGPAALFC